MMADLAQLRLRRQTSYTAMLLVTVSGTSMAMAGHTLASTGWTNARLPAFAGGLAIQVAFLVERRDARRNNADALSQRHWRTRLAASGFIAAAGAILVLGGYTSTSHGWWPIGAAAIPAIIAITIALRFNRHAVQRPPPAGQPLLHVTEEHSPGSLIIDCLDPPRLRPTPRGGRPAQTRAYVDRLHLRGQFAHDICHIT